MHCLQVPKEREREMAEEHSIHVIPDRQGRPGLIDRERESRKNFISIFDCPLSAPATQKPCAWPWWNSLPATWAPVHRTFPSPPQSSVLKVNRQRELKWNEQKSFGGKGAWSGQRTIPQEYSITCIEIILSLDQSKKKWKTSYSDLWKIIS